MKTTAAEKVLRDTKVVSDRAHGYTWQTVASRHGLSESQCRNIWRERPAKLEYLTLDASETIDELLAQIDAIIEDVAELAGSTTNDSVRLGAIKTRSAAITQKIDVLQGLGRLPSLARIAQEIEVDALTDALLKVFKKYEVPDPAVHEFLEALTAEAVGLSTRHRRLTFVPAN